LSIGSADEVGLHVVDSSLRIHQVLIVFTFDLDHPHHDAVDHVDRLTFLVAFTHIIIVACITFYRLILKIISIDCLFVVSDVAASPLLVELLFWVESYRDLEFFDYLHHFLLVHVFTF